MKNRLFQRLGWILFGIGLLLIVTWAIPKANVKRTITIKLANALERITPEERVVIRSMEDQGKVDSCQVQAVLQSPASLRVGKKTAIMLEFLPTCPQGVNAINIWQYHVRFQDDARLIQPTGDVITHSQLVIWSIVSDKATHWNGTIWLYLDSPPDWKNKVSIPLAAIPVQINIKTWLGFSQTGLLWSGGILMMMGFSLIFLHLLSLKNARPNS
jgi:hypothetical protein